MIDFDQSTYAAQLNEKAERLKALLAPFGVTELDCYESPKSHYRQRAEFHIRHHEGRAYYAMNETVDGKKRWREVTTFPVASHAINNLMPKLMEQINGNEALQHRLFQIEFHGTSTGDMLTTLIYHRQLDDAWKEEALKLQDELDTQIIGRARKQRVVLGRDWVTEVFNVIDQTFIYRQFENAFAQPNAEVCKHMLSWAIEQTDFAGGDLLELYCGNGNFTLPLAKNFDRVLATEISKTAIKGLQFNIDENSANNITHARLSAEEMVEALDKVRPFRRLAEVDLDSYNFTTLMVDPPRAGLDQTVRDLAMRFDNVLYISCNPETLARDLEQLSERFEVKQAALFDQFPYTHHMESGVWLVKKG